MDSVVLVLTPAFKVLDADYTCLPGRLSIELSDGATAAHGVTLPDATAAAPGRAPKPASTGAPR